MPATPPIDAALQDASFLASATADILMPMADLSAGLSSPGLSGGSRARLPPARRLQPQSAQRQLPEGLTGPFSHVPAPLPRRFRPPEGDHASGDKPAGQCVENATCGGSTSVMGVHMPPGGWFAKCRCVVWAQRVPWGSACGKPACSPRAATFSAPCAACLAPGVAAQQSPPARLLLQQSVIGLACRGCGWMTAHELRVADSCMPLCKR